MAGRRGGVNQRRRLRRPEGGRATELNHRDMRDSTFNSAARLGRATAPRP